VKDQKVRIGGEVVKSIPEKNFVDIRRASAINGALRRTRIASYFAYDITEW